MSFAVLTDRASQAEAGPTRQRRSVPWLLVVPLSLAAASAIVLFGVLRTDVNAGSIVLMCAVASMGLVGVQFWRALRSAWQEPAPDGVRVPGSRHRRELEREKKLLLKAIKELEFDHAMKKVSDVDFEDAYGVYRARVIRVMVDLDAGEDAAYREIIEAELAERMGSGRRQGSKTEGSPACMCGVENDPDAVFCKKCGRRLAEEARA